MVRDAKREIYLQVSWIEDVSAAASGDHPIKLYDEQGYAALRKVI